MILESNEDAVEFALDQMQRHLCWLVAVLVVEFKILLVFIGDSIFLSYETGTEQCAWHLTNINICWESQWYLSQA